MVKITTKQFKSRLKEKFGHDFNCGEYTHHKTSMSFECPKCLNTFYTRPDNVLGKLSKSMCNSCSYRESGNKRIIKKTKFKRMLQIKFSTAVIKIKKYKSYQSPAKFKCLVCNTSWVEPPKSLMHPNRYSCCKHCATLNNLGKERITQASLIKRSAVRNPSITINSKYLGVRKNVNITCSKCECNYDVRAEKLLYGKKDYCPSCSSSISNQKLISLNNIEVKVQGYEPQAIQYLINRGIKESEINVFSSGKIPKIPYKLQGKDHMYLPDICVNKTIYEVKSARTLFGAFNRNKAKAKACIKKGYNFNILFGLNFGDWVKIIKLPKLWYTMTQPKLERFIAAKMSHNLRILSFDPGPVNMGWAVIRGTRKRQTRVVASGKLFSPFRNLTCSPQEMRQQFNDFKGELEGLIELFDINAICCERFMSRGLKGPTIELVNFMLGIIVGTALKPAITPVRKKFKFVIPAQWKNEWNKHNDLKAFYKTTNTEPHQVDAVGIGLYCAADWYNKPFYEDINFNKLAKDISNTNWSKQINGRIPAPIQSNIG